MKTKQELYKARPTSPHLGIYRMQISSVMSIFHRMTGIMLFGALAIIAWWMIFWIFSKFNPDYINIVASCWIIKSASCIVSFGFFYHLCNGIRHLMWDVGKGFSIKELHITGWVAISVACIMTVIFWVYIL